MNTHTRAIIFDFNGVISDDEPLHLEIFRRTLAELGIRISDRDYYEKYLGRDDRRCFQTALMEAGVDADGAEIERLIARKARCYLDAVAAAGPPLFPGVADLIRNLSARYPLAVASGALRVEIEAVLSAAGIRDCFGAVVSADDVTESKPHPQIFLCALDELNRTYEEHPPIAPIECLVIEDSRSGVEAARRAGMRCLAVATSFPAEALAAADWVVRNLEGFDPAGLRENTEQAE
ncbi:MAG: HAD family phosphatase [Acidobacteria bacterium]|nr:HAD family phosphatase [Acidobacteriota bacterium]